MKKILMLPIFLFVSIACFSPSVFSQTAQNKNSDSNELILDKTELYLPCPPGYGKDKFKCSPGTAVKVETKLSNSTGKFTYKYSVSGGKIDGSGKEVNWDLTSLRPGTYKISVTVIDSYGKETKLSKSITLTSCASCFEECLICPTVSITSSGEEIEKGKIVTFTANISGIETSEVNYKWKVSNGEIIEGQDTSAISVKADDAASKDLTVTLNIDGICPDCEKVFTKLIRIISK